MKITIERDGRITLHFEGMKAKVRHSLAKELEKLIGPATERQHGADDEEIKGRIQQNLRMDEEPE